MTVEAAKDDAQNGNGQDDQKTDTGNTSDPTADDQNKGDETPADSTTDPSNDANTSDGGNNGSTTTEVTLAVDDTVAESGLTFKSTESQQITVKNNYRTGSDSSCFFNRCGACSDNRSFRTGDSGW